MGIDEKLLDSLVKKCGSPEDVHALLGDLTKGIMERALNAEMNHHLGYEKHDTAGTNSGNSRNGHSKKSVITDQGKLEISIPRDRNGDFEPQIIEKGQRRFNGFDDKIISMYGLGMTTRDIQHHLKDIYKVDVSAELISKVTEEVLEEVHAWQKRPLEPLYSIVYFDALRVKVREDNRILSKSAYIALGVDIDGYRDVLGLWIEKSEGARFWMNVVADLQNRGVEDILIACVDGLKGFPEAIEAVFPQTDVQVCIVHMIRNSYKYVPYKHCREYMSDLKKVYQAVSLEAAENALNDLEDKWSKKYPYAVKGWRNNWHNLSVMFSYPKDLRRLIYTTNPIESLNASLRKVTKNKRVFPNDNAVFKQLFLAITKRGSRWTSKTSQWKKIRNQLQVLFEERIKKAFTQNF